MNTLEQDGKIEIPAKYLAALSRFKWVLILAIAMLSGIAVFVASIIPPTYRSEAIVLVETQQIPDELVRSTVTSIAAERIQIIKQRVMTRDRMLDLMDKYPDLREAMDGMLVSEQVAQLRENVNIEMISSSANPRARNATTIAFKVGFDARDPNTSQAAANDLVTMFLDENVRTRTERATETTGFLESEAAKMRERLAETETAIANFKSENKDALPEHLDLYLSMLERARSEAVEIRRQIEVETNQASLYETDLANNVDVVEENPDLLRLEAEYARLTSLYKDTHPDVKAVAQQLDAARNIKKTSSQSLGEQLLMNKIAASEQQRRLLRQELVQVRESIEELEAKVVLIPQVEQGLIALNRDYRAVQAQYDQLVSSTMEAQMAESLEQGRKAERFSLLEAPVVPDQPHSPDRKKLLAGGVAASAGLPLALVLAFGFFDRSVRGTTAVEKLLGQAPLASVGVINPGSKHVSFLVKALWSIGILLALLIVAIAVVHTQVMPLDTYVYQAIYKFNLEGLIP